MNGNGKTLRETQAYPEGYGQSLADMYEAINTEADEVSSDFSDEANESAAQLDEWDGARMEPIATLLSVPRSRKLM